MKNLKHKNQSHEAPEIAIGADGNSKAHTLKQQRIAAASNNITVSKSMEKSMRRQQSQEVHKLDVGANGVP
jgi:hypothetical protein